MIVNNIPPYEERPLVHSETILMDLSPIGQMVSDSALQQLSNAKVKLENILSPAALVVQHMGPTKVNDINTFRANLNAFRPNFDMELINHYNYNLTQGMVVNLSQDQFFQLAYDTFFKVYLTYHFFFCNIYAEIRNKCNVLGYANVELLIHTVNAENGVGKLAIGCYAR